MRGEQRGLHRQAVVARKVNAGPVNEATDGVRRGGTGVPSPDSSVGVVPEQAVDEGDFGGVVNPKDLEVVWHNTLKDIKLWSGRLHEGEQRGLGRW